MNDIVKAGGRIGVGSHGQLDGIGYHWELWSYAMGGMTPMDILRCATTFGAQAIGLQNDLGTVESGKLADLVIMDRESAREHSQLELGPVRDEERPPVRRQHARRGVSASAEDGDGAGHVRRGRQ